MRKALHSKELDFVFVSATHKMEYDKINNLLLSEDSEKLSKFVTREYVSVNSLSNALNENKSVRFKTPMLRSDLCDLCVIEDADDLDIVMPMYNLLEHSKNYRKNVGSLYNYYRDESNNDADIDNFANNNVVSSEAFKYKTKII